MKNYDSIVQKVYFEQKTFFFKFWSSSFNILQLLAKIHGIFIYTACGLTFSLTLFLYSAPNNVISMSTAWYAQVLDEMKSTNR